MDLRLTPNAHLGAIKHLGEKGFAAWNKQLPRRTQKLLDKWGLVFSKNLMAGTRGVVLLCDSTDGKMVLKISYNEEEIAGESQALLAWQQTNTRCITRLYRYELGAIATYHAQGECVNREHTNIEPTLIINSLMNIHRIAPQNHALPSLYQDIAARLHKAQARLEHIENCNLDRYLRSSWSRLREMCAKENHYLVHADCHSGNLIAGENAVIWCDPKGAVGDPHYDCAMWALKADLGNEQEMWLSLFSRAGYDRRRMEAWMPIVAFHETVSYLYYQKSLERLASCQEVMERYF